MAYPPTGTWEQSEGDVSSSVAARVALGAVSVPRRSVTGSFWSKQPVEIVTSAAASEVIRLPIWSVLIGEPNTGEGVHSAYCQFRGYRLCPRAYR